MHCFCQFRLLKPSTNPPKTGWVINSRNLLVTVLEAKQSTTKVPCLVRAGLLVQRVCSCHVLTWWKRQGGGELFIRTLIPLTRAPLSWPDLHPKSPTFKYCNSGIFRFQHIHDIYWSLYPPPKMHIFKILSFQIKCARESYTTEETLLTGMGCHSFLQGISWPRDQTWVSCIAARFFPIWATWEACLCKDILFIHRSSFCSGPSSLASSCSGLFWGSRGSSWCPWSWPQWPGLCLFFHCPRIGLSLLGLTASVGRMRLR